MPPPSTPVRSSRDRAKTTNTPTQANRAVTSSAIFSGLDKGRDALMADIGCAVPLVPLSYFYDYLLPPLPRPVSAKVDEIIQDLEAPGGVIVNGRWTSFPKDPENSGSSEGATFKDFGSIGDAIATSAINVSRGALTDGDLTTKFIPNPNRPPVPTLRDNKSRPDVCSQFLVPSVPGIALKPNQVYWEDIAEAGEEKKRGDWSDINDNVRKILWTFNQAMRDSPRRRFMFGHAIENTTMRLWFCSRKDILVSEPFNFITEHERLIRFMLPIMFARSSELGFDPTVTIVQELGSPKRRYQIVVRAKHEDGSSTDTTYRTQEVIANIGAEAVRGRGTRVWSVREVVDNEEVGDELVLKDCWIDYDRMREGDTLKEIRSPDLNDVDRAVFDKHLLTVVCHGDVYIEGQLDNTKTLMRRNSDIPTELGWYKLKRSGPKSGPKDVKMPPKGSGIVDEVLSSAKTVVEYDEKTHYRIVFKERATPIDTLEAGCWTFFYLSQVLRVLRTLHLHGWVHRDISVANILYIKDRGAIVADFEYAEKLKDATSDKDGHTRRTGTAFFTAVEVEANQYLFVPQLFGELEKPSKQLPWQDMVEPYSELSTVADLLDSKDDSTTRTTSQSPAPLGTLEEHTEKYDDVESIVSKFRYNPLHDLESFWWLSGYLSVPRKITYHGYVDDAAAKARYQQMQDFFDKNFKDRAKRKDTFSDLNKFYTGVRLLDPKVRKIGHWLENFRQLLVATYRSAEKNLDGINRTVAEDVYREVWTGLVGIWKALEGKTDITLSPIGLQMVVDHDDDPEPAPVASSNNTAAVQRTKRDHDSLDSLGNNLPAAPTGARQASRSAAKRAHLDPKANTRHTPRNAAVQGGDSSDEDTATGPSRLVAAASMMSVVTTAGDMSTMPVNEAAGLSIADPVTGAAGQSSSAPQEAGPSRLASNSHTNVNPKGKGRGKGKGKGKEQPTEAPRRSKRTRKLTSKGKNA